MACWVSWGGKKVPDIAQARRFGWEILAHFRPFFMSIPWHLVQPPLYLSCQLSTTFCTWPQIDAILTINLAATVLPVL